MIEAGRKVKQLLPHADVRLPVCGPFSLLGNLIGLDTLLVEVLTDPQGVRRALAHCVEGQKAYLRAIAAAGLGVTLFDSGATPPLLSPHHFRQLVSQALTELVHTTTAETGTPAACIVGGNTAPIAADLLRTGAGYLICPVETNGEMFVTALQSRPDVRTRVNMNPAVFTIQDLAPVLEEVERAAGLARRRVNTCIGTGVVPFDTDPELVLRARDHARAL
jgi:uroporphyrinogen-III decarboxylase